ncbi:MAG: DUF1461 domain-containing protein [Eubacteriales bacterium]|nr:DUF1461 domain-containing protein [Eubacteriales bacterium]
MRVFLRVISVIIAVCVPIVVMLGASNIVFRMPDIYTYEFRSMETVRELNFSITDDELGHFFSDFMRGKNEKFELFIDYEDREQSVFGPNEQLNMDNARRLLNYTVYAFGVSALLLIIGYWVLLNKKRKSELRTAFKGGIAVFASLQILLYVLFFYDNTRSFFYNLIFTNPYGADDLLPLILTKHVAKICIYANSIAAIVIMLIFFSVTWRLTKPRRIFW